MRGCHAPAALYTRKDPVPIVQEAGWAPGPIWTDAENLALTGIQSPDRPACRYTDYGTQPTVTAVKPPKIQNLRSPYHVALQAMCLIGLV